MTNPAQLVALCLLSLMSHKVTAFDMVDIVAQEDIPEMHPPWRGKEPGSSDNKPGPVWLQLEDYLGTQKYRQQNDPKYSLDAMADNRKGGTFWYADFSGIIGQDGYNLVEDLFKDLERDHSCALTFLYDDMESRLSEADRSEQTKSTDYMKPVAIAPICTPTDDKGSPFYDDDSWVADSVIYLNMRANTDFDACLVLSDMKNVTDPQVGFEAFGKVTFRGGYTVHEASPTVGVDAGLLQDWLKQYIAESRNNEGAPLPNPYKYRFGDQVWSKWNQAQKFWGYEASEENGRHWRTISDVGGVKTKRSRADGTLGA